jgi:alkanesulfonate monooxygenase SsuD/methylene tetrahydromethanopterin reductase-like flavin-dependent oxidoreductase (luciferase family)
LTDLRFGVLLPQTNWVASTEAIRDAAQGAEALGFDAVSVHDHIQYNGWFIASGSRQPVAGGDQRNLYDAIATLAYVAAITTRVRLLTSILLVPVREPIVTAKQLATVDRLSGGRLVVGVGVGPPLRASEGETTRLEHHRSNAHKEYDAFGLRGSRGPLVDEYLEAMIAIWTTDPATYHGRHVSFDEIDVHPKPVQRPHIPIWVGGRSDFALERVVRFGGTWNPSQVSPRQFEEAWASLAQRFAAAGKPMPTERAINTYAVIADTDEEAEALAAPAVGPMFYTDPDFRSRTLVGSPATWIERLREWRSLGLTLCELKPVYHTVDDLLAQLERVAREVMPAMAEPADPRP